MVEVPEVVAEKARVHGAQAWLDTLPDLLGAVADEWGLTLGRSHDGGTEAFVVDAETAEGTPAVLKLMVPRPGGAAAHEIAVLRAIGGDGCPLLLRCDAERGAMLTERLGPAMADLDIPVRRRHELLCATAARIWRPVGDLDLPTGAEKGRWLIEFITEKWDALDRPCARRTVEHAVARAEARIAAHDDERAVLVHGDVHQWNALQAGDGFKLIDPDGLRAEPEYDLGVLMREDPEEFADTDPWDRAHRLAQLTGTDPAAVWDWGVVERVSTGLLATEIGLEPVGAQMLEVADRVAADPPD